MKHKPLILASLLLAAFLINLETTIVNVALPTLVRQLHATDSQLQWVVDAYNLVFAAAVLAAGSLSDRFGRKGMLLAGLAMFGVASIAGGLTNDPGQLIATRAVMGIGSALFVFTIIEAPNHGWGSARTLGSFAVAALLATAFVAWERRTDHPILDVDLFRNPRFAAASAAIGISFFALSGFIFLVTQMFQFLKGYGPLSTGVRLLPVASCVGISSILGTKLAVRVGTKLIVGAGLFAMGAFYVWVASSSATTGYGTIAAQMVVLGTGIGLTSAPP